MRLAESQDSFHPDAGTVTEPVFCGVCSRQMDVRRDVKMPRSMAEAYSSHGKSDYKFDPCDVFTCPNHKEDWHFQITLLYDEISRTNSSVIEKLLREEIDLIRNTQKPTKRFFNSHTKSYSME